jgi:hypothetical protein
MHRDEFFRCAVEPLQTGACADPQIVFRIFQYGQYGIVHQGCRIVGDIVECFEIDPIENVQSVVGTNPNQSSPVLIYFVYMTV